jgi:recombination DNA repair RAD52 pathway protein
MKNRSRNNSLDQICKKNKDRSNSIEFYIHGGSEKSTRSYSIGSIESIYLDEDNENEYNNKNKHPLLTSRDSYDVPKVNECVHSNTNTSTSMYNHTEFIHQDTKKGRKRDVYVCDISESPKPSKFIEYMQRLMRK